MFETAINIFENALITAFIVLLARKRKPMKGVLICASLYFLFSYFFISYINLFSFSQSFLVIIDYAAGWALACLVSYDPLGYKLFSGVLPYNLLGISNVLLDMTASYVLFGTINYNILMANYRVPIVLAAQIIHVLLYALCIHISRHMFSVVQDKDYYILSTIFILLDLMSVCFETVALQFDHYEMYMLLGIYLIVVFAVMAVFLFRSIYRHSILETQQNLELDILRSQESSNQKILEAQNRLNEIRHDMKHFIVLLEQSDIHSSELQDLIDRYHQTTNSFSVPIQTSCAPINYVLNIKREEAFARGITFITKANIPHEVNMETGDIYLLFANLLDNAIQHIGMGKKILLEMNDVKDMFMIRVTNSIDFPVIGYNGEISRSRTEDGHGYGIRTVEKILEKYDGFISFNENDSDFIATALIPVSELTDK